MIKLRALVAKGHKNTNAPLIFENLGYYFFLVLGKLHNGPFLGIFEMAHYVVCPQKKNNIPHFQNQRCINSYFVHPIEKCLK
jgi:hypothetical protein